MSRRHFQALANALQLNAPSPTSETYQAERVLFARIVKDVARACASSNVRFNYDRFERACGLMEIK